MIRSNRPDPGEWLPKPKLDPASNAIDPVLDYWAERFRVLDVRYGVHRLHGYTFGQFYGDPRHADRWIPMFFANPGLFLHRPRDSSISLNTFLASPETILKAALKMDQSYRKYLGRIAKRSLVQDSEARKFMRRYMGRCATPRKTGAPWPARCERTLEVRGGVLFEPFHRRCRILKFRRMPVWIRQRKMNAYDAS